MSAIGLLYCMLQTSLPKLSFMCCDIVYSYLLIKMFRRSMLPPSTELGCVVWVFADLRRQVARTMLPRAGPNPVEIFVEKQPL
jgi:hypothetical protein